MTTRKPKTPFAKRSLMQQASIIVKTIDTIEDVEHKRQLIELISKGLGL